MRHASSFSTSALSTDPQFVQNVLFSFLKGLKLLPGGDSTASLRDTFCATLLALVQICIAGGDLIICAQSFCMVSEMFPDSIFADQQDHDSLSRNQAIKSAALKLIEGDSSMTQQIDYHAILFVVTHPPDVTSQDDPWRGAVYFCSRLTSPLVASLTGLREMTTEPSAQAFRNLVRVGTELGVCVCPARANLELVEDTLRRKAMLDEWAPILCREAVGCDDCPTCRDSLASPSDQQASFICGQQIPVSRWSF